jgi:Zn-dependent M28 family amino/carboxypeptidase
MVYALFGLAVIRGRFLRETGTNLVATRGGPEPRLWLAAHLDTKSQPIPTLVRVIGVVLATIAVLVLFALYWADIVVEVSASVWIATGVGSVIAALPLMASTVGNDSPGAADNASGVAAVLRVAAETGDAPLGVLLTSAEELGLAGAKAWAAANWPYGKRRRPYLILNCDTLDDEGILRCVRHRAEDDAVAREVVQMSQQSGMQARVTRVTPGIMVDSSAFAARSIPAVTLSRVTWRTLGRIHTARDDASRLRGSGVAQAAGVMAAMVRAHG